MVAAITFTAKDHPQERSIDVFHKHRAAMTSALVHPRGFNYLSPIMNMANLIPY